MTNYIIYTEILGNTIERWFYDMYSDCNEANEVAMELGGSYPIFHCVCDADKAKELGVQNLPF